MITDSKPSTPERAAELEAYKARHGGKMPAPVRQPPEATVGSLRAYLARFPQDTPVDVYDAYLHGPGNEGGFVRLTLAEDTILVDPRTGALGFYA